MVEDVGLVESFLKEEPEKRLAFLLANRCEIDDPTHARDVLLKEKLSGLVRSLALLSLLIDLLTSRNTTFHKQILDALDEEGTKGKTDTLPIAARRPTPQWAPLLTTYRRAIQFFEIAGKLKGEVIKLKVLKPDQLEFSQFDQLWNQFKVNRLDYYMSGLRRLIQVGDILPVPSSQFWPTLTQRWGTAQTKLSESISAVERDVDAANVRFQDLYLEALREVADPTGRPGHLHAPVHPEGLEDALGRPERTEGRDPDLRRPQGGRLGGTGPSRP